MIWSIRERRTFDELVRRGSRVRTATLWCTCLPLPDSTPPRVAFAIGRAVGSAVVRNRVRRRLRMLISAEQLPPGRYLIGARPPVTKRTFEELRMEVQALCERIRAAQIRAAQIRGVT